MKSALTRNGQSGYFTYINADFMKYLTQCYTMDPLVELPVDQWNLLKKKLKAMWPMNAAGYYALYVNEKHPQVRTAFQFKVYCPFGDMDHGFVSINVKSPETQDVIVFSTSDDARKLEEALLRTQLICWNKAICIDIVCSSILRSLQRIRPLIGLEKFEVGMCNMYLLSSEVEPFDIRAPPHTRVAAVKPDHISRVDQVWPYRFNGSHTYFSVLASNHLSYGLYSNDQLLAWVFLNEYNFLCHLYCEEGHRGKGFAEYLLKVVANEELARGNDVYGYAVMGNVPAMRLFEKLGFKNVDQAAYIFAQRG